MKAIRAIIQTFLDSEVKPLDIWDVEIKCTPGGAILKVVEVADKREVNPIQEIDINTGDTINTTLYHRRMSNYCSIGLDAKIGLGFDHKRTNNRILNKAVYAWEGFKNFCLPQKRMKSVIKKMDTIISCERGSQELLPVPQQNQRIGSYSIVSKPIFSTNSIQIQSNIVFFNS